MIQVDRKVLRLCPVSGGNRTVEALLLDATVAGSVNKVGDMRVAHTIWPFPNRLTLCVIFDPIHVRLAVLAGRAARSWLARRGRWWPGLRLGSTALDEPDVSIASLANLATPPRTSDKIIASCIPVALFDQRVESCELCKLTGSQIVSHVNEDVLGAGARHAIAVDRFHAGSSTFDVLTHQSCTLLNCKAGLTRHNC